MTSDWLTQVADAAVECSAAAVPGWLTQATGVAVVVACGAALAIGLPNMIRAKAREGCSDRVILLGCILVLLASSLYPVAWLTFVEPTAISVPRLVNRVAVFAAAALIVRLALRRPERRGG